MKTHNPFFIPAFILSLLPVIRLIWLGINNQLSANPIEFITRSTGTWALVLLCITLTISPFHHFFRTPHLLQLRRTFGLFSFFYAGLHVLTWVGLDHQGDWVEIVKDLSKRTYLTIGLFAFILLIPLAVTSNKFSQSILRRSWKKLHRLIYLIAILVILHYWRHKAGKNDYETVAIYSVVVFSLLAWRLVAYVRHLRKSMN